MKVELTKSKIKNLADFIELTLISAIREDADIDNINWVVDMAESYKILRKAEEESEDE